MPYAPFSGEYTSRNAPTQYETFADVEIFSAKAITSSVIIRAGANNVYNIVLSSDPGAYYTTKSTLPTDYAGLPQ